MSSDFSSDIAFYSRLEKIGFDSVLDHGYFPRRNVQALDQVVLEGRSHHHNVIGIAIEESGDSRQRAVQQ